MQCDGSHAVVVVQSQLMMQVLVNLYSAHMDPDDWQQPQQFRPERFLDESGNVINRDRVIAFSLGTAITACVVVIPYIYCLVLNAIN